MSTATMPDSTAAPRTERRAHKEKPDASALRIYGVRRRTVNLVMLACVVFAVFTLIPIWWIIVSSTKTVPNFNSTFGFWFARPFELLSNLKEVFSNQEDGSYLQWLANTAIYAGAGGVGRDSVVRDGWLRIRPLRLPRQERVVRVRHGRPSHPARRLRRPALPGLRQGRHGQHDARHIHPVHGQPGQRVLDAGLRRGVDPA